MAYDLFIHRWPDIWNHDELAGGIVESEWNYLVANDPELEPKAEVSVTNPSTGEVIRMKAPGMVLWTSPTGRPLCMLRFSSGHISFRAPDDAVVMAKMFEVAGQLDARIQGEEGEWYEPPTAS